MRELVIDPQPWHPAERRQRATAKPEMIDEEVVVYDSSGAVLLASVRMLETEDTRWLARKLRLKTRWDDGSSGTSQSRLSGIRYESRVFGYTEPKPLRKRYGASTALLHTQEPALGDTLLRLTGKMWSTFQEVAPKEAAAHEELVSTIHPDWHIAGQPWTSGIINNSAGLPYHQDSGNVKHSWSAMLGLRKDVAGAGLHLPELGITISVFDHSVTIFDGGRLWHGVTPLEPSGTRAHRYTLVWYAKNGFRSCGPAAEEARRAAESATRLASAHLAG